MPLLRIESLDDERLALFRGLRDAVLMKYPGTENGLFMGESAKVITRALDAGYEPYAMLAEDRWVLRSQDIMQRMTSEYPHVPIYLCTNEVFKGVTGFKITRCSLTAFHRKPLPSVSSLLADARRVAVLEDITNYTNIGAIFRSAAGLGMDAVLVTPRCHDPLYHRASRVSMGTVFQVPWTRLATQKDWACEGVELLHELGFKVAALALDEDSISLDDERLSACERLALVLGTEGDGLARSTIAHCDYTVKIPMEYGVDSLNVAAASAVAFWELRCKSR